MLGGRRCWRVAGVGAVVLAREQIAGAFGRKREFIPIALESCPAAAILKVSMVPRKMNDAVTLAARAADEHGVAWAVMARGIGVIYFVLLAQGRDENSRGRVAAIVEKIVAAIAGIDGHAAIPWCPLAWKASLRV